jgi:hypothetical protein
LGRAGVNPGEASTVTLEKRFWGRDDPSVDRTEQHTSLDIIVIAIGAVICSAGNWVDVEE